MGEKADPFMGGDGNRETDEEEREAPQTPPACLVREGKEKGHENG